MRLCLEAAHAGGDASTILNAANEIAVQSFLDGELKFPDIANVIERGMADATSEAPESLEDVLAIDAEARARAIEEVGRRAAA